MKALALLVRWLRRSALIGGATLMLLAVIAAAWQTSSTWRLEQAHPPPGRLVDVGGHRLHLHVRGHGSPTVVIDAGLSGASYDYEQVAAGIAGFTQVATYDRAGNGWSDPGPRPRTSQRAVAELRTLLANSGLRPPFILLGHSWGGLNARLYASQHPEEVAGLILVDALNTDLKPDSETAGDVPVNFTVLYHTAFLGTPRLIMPGIVREPRDDVATREFRLAMLTRTKTARTIYEELTGQRDWLEVRGSLKHLGDLPVTVITTLPDPALADQKMGLGGLDWRRGQEALPGISRRSRFVVADTPEHNIQFYRPEQIVAAVRVMVEGLRQGTAPAGR